MKFFMCEMHAYDGFKIYFYYIVSSYHPMQCIRKLAHPRFGWTLYVIPIAGSNHIRLNTMLQGKYCDSFSTSAGPTSWILIVQKHIQFGFELDSVCY